MEWLILLLFPLPFFAMYKMATWLERIESADKLKVLPDAIQKALQPIFCLLWWALLLFGTPYFIYSDAKIISRLSKYNECPCDASVLRKQFFCLYSWDFLAEITYQPRRQFTKRDLDRLATLKQQVDSGELTDRRSFEVLHLAIEKQEADSRDLKYPSAYPPMLPLCENAP